MGQITGGGCKVRILLQSTHQSVSKWYILSQETLKPYARSDGGDVTHSHFMAETSKQQCELKHRVKCPKFRLQSV